MIHTQPMEWTAVDSHMHIQAMNINAQVQLFSNDLHKKSLSLSNNVTTTEPLSLWRYHKHWHACYTSSYMLHVIKNNG